MTPHDARGPARQLRKVLHERTFAGTRLTPYKRDFARSRACVVQVARQFIELWLAFEEVHGNGEYPARRPPRTWAVPTWGLRPGNLGSSPDLRMSVHAYRPLH
jgi:hypothetical protein